MLEPIKRFKDFIITMKDNLVPVVLSLTPTHIVAAVKKEYQETREKLKNLKQTNWELAQYHYSVGNINDGIFRFKILQRYNYRSDEANYFIGRLYMEKFKYARAKDYLNKYLKTDDKNHIEEAEYCLKAMKGENITSIPRNLILKKSSTAVFNLDHKIIDGLTLVVFNSLLQVLRGELEKSSKIFEIGCGIGLFGKIMRSELQIQYLSAIDPSKDYIKTAGKLVNNVNNKQIYDHLAVAWPDEIAVENNNKYSVVLMHKILEHYNDIEMLLSKAYDCLAENGVINIAFRGISIKDFTNFSFSHECVVSDEGNLNIKPLVSDNNIEKNISDNNIEIKFINQLEVFTYSPFYILKIAKKCKLNLKSSVRITTTSEVVFGIFSLEKS